MARRGPVLTVAVLAIGALVLSSCDWPQFRLGPEHSGYNATESTIGVGNVGSLVEKWTATTGGAVYSSPAVVNGVLYVGSYDNKLYAFDANGKANCSGTPKTCAPLWTAPTGGLVYSSPAVANGVVYVGSSDNNLYAFDANGKVHCAGTPKTCAPLWTAPTGGAVTSSPAVADGVIYVGSDDNKLYAFDANGKVHCAGTPKSCAPLWTGVPVGAATTHSSPAVGNGVVYLSSAAGGCNRLFCIAWEQLSAFDAAGTAGCSGTPKTCSPLWTTKVTGGYVDSSPAIANGVLYVGSWGTPATLYGYDAAGTAGCSGVPKSCAPVWSASTQGAIESSPAVANGVVYVGSDDHTFYAFDATSGATVWTGATGGPVGSSPAVANGVVYVGSSDGKLYAFAAAGQTGCGGIWIPCSPLWTATTGGPVDSSPAVANGMVYVGSADGTVHAYGLP
jgi:outer membrane protein assembly factor BamB